MLFTENYEVDSILVEVNLTSDSGLEKFETLEVGLEIDEGKNCC